MEARNKLSDTLSRDMRKRGFNYLGSITVYSHLQACGIINDHVPECWMYQKLVKEGNIHYVNGLRPNRYQAHFYVFANIYTYSLLTADSIQPVKGSELKGAFDFRIIASGSDSTRILFGNHTNLSVQPVFLPSVGTDELYTVHPLARSGWVGEADYMKSCALLKSGEAMLLSIPVAWDSSRISNPNEKEKYKSGKLLPGMYKIGLQLEVYMDTEFEVK